MITAEFLAPFIARLREQGIRVENGTKYCEGWMASHRGCGGCHGCESEEGCFKLARIAFLRVNCSLAAAVSVRAESDEIDHYLWSQAMAIIGEPLYRSDVPDTFRSAFGS